MLPADLQDALARDPASPLWIWMPPGLSPLNAWDTPSQFVVAVDGRTWELPPLAAPFLANVWSQRVVHGVGWAPLQHFDVYARVRPRQYVDVVSLLEMTAYLQQRAGVLTIPAEGPAALQAVSDAYPAIREAYQTSLRPYALYVADWMAARMLLAVVQARGYVSPDGLTVLHPKWQVHPAPSRITTTHPPLHALPRATGATYRARPGLRWVVVTWPDVVTSLATRVVHGTALPRPVLGSDYILGRHDVPQPEDSGLTAADVDMLLALQRDWHATQRSYPLPTPPSRDGEKSVGKMALEAVSAFTVAQLAILFRAWVRDVPALLGLCEVIPGLGSLTFQVDDRVPLPLLVRYAQEWHAFHVEPTVWVGQTWGTLYAAADKLTPVALDLDKPTQWPVECPVCGGRADCERDLQQHYLEDHGGVRV